MLNFGLSGNVQAYQQNGVGSMMPFCFELVHSLHMNLWLYLLSKVGKRFGSFSAKIWRQFRNVNVLSSLKLKATFKERSKTRQNSTLISRIEGSNEQAFSVGNKQIQKNFLTN